MEPRRVEQKFRVLDLEAAASFTNSAFAKNDDLLSRPEGLDHAGPFLEGDAHEGSVRQRAKASNAQTAVLPGRHLGGWKSKDKCRAQTACPARTLCIGSSRSMNSSIRRLAPQPESRRPRLQCFRSHNL